MRHRYLLLAAVMMSACAHAWEKPSPCADKLLAGNYMGSSNQPDKRRQAFGICTQFGDENVAMAEDLMDGSYVRSLKDGIHATTGATREQVECAKAEFNQRKDDKRVFKISDACRMAVPVTATPDGPVTVKADTSTGPGDVLAVASANPQLSTFVGLLKLEPAMADVLGQPGPLTLIAPTDEAFTKVPASTMKKLQTDAKERLSFLQKYIIRGRLPLDEAKPHRASFLPGSKDKAPSIRVETLGGKRWHIHYEGEQLLIENANIDPVDVPASNGAVDVIDKVLFH